MKVWTLQYKTFSFSLQAITVLVGKYSFTKLSKFNEGDFNDSSLARFSPPLTKHMFNVARKLNARNGHILGSLEQVKRMVWKLSDVQVKIMFDYFSSSQTIQNVAFGTIKSKDQFGNTMVMSKVIRLQNKTDLVTNCLAYFAETGVPAPDRSTIFHYL